MKTISFAGRHSPVLKGLAVAGAAACVFAMGYATAAQPHMQAALGALRAAKNELALAEHNKGGHRASAPGLVDQAIRQVELGIQAGGG